MLADEGQPAAAAAQYALQARISLARGDSAAARGALAKARAAAPGDTSLAALSAALSARPR